MSDDLLRRIEAIEKQMPALLADKIADMNHQIDCLTKRYLALEQRVAAKGTTAFAYKQVLGPDTYVSPTPAHIPPHS